MHQSPPGTYKLNASWKEILSKLLDEHKESTRGNGSWWSCKPCQWKCLLTKDNNAVLVWLRSGSPHYPSNPMQPGPIYFKTSGKCGIFGVMYETIWQQVNFLIDEACSAGKGANASISYVDFYFEHHRFGEKNAHLNAGNCAGQKKKLFCGELGLQNFHTPPQYNSLFISYCWSHQIWPRLLFRDRQKSLQSHLRLVYIWNRRDSWNFKQCWH